MASLSLLHSLSHSSSDPSLKLFMEATNQWWGDNFCSLTKPHLHYYRCYTHFPKLLTDFHWFHCSHRHSSDTIFGFLQILWCKEKQLISSTAILWFCFLYRISLVLSFSLSFPRYNLLSFLNFCDKRISIYVTRFAKRGLIRAQFQDTLFIAIC